MMETGSHFQRFRHRYAASLSLKLIGIFVSGSVALAALMWILSQIGLERQFLSTARPLLDHYVHYLSEQVGTPPDVEKARKLTDEWPVIVRIFDPGRGVEWASDGRAGFGNLNDQSDGRILWDDGTLLIRQKTGTATVYYGFRIRPEGPPWFALIFIGLVLLGLVGFFLLTRRLFSPIESIQQGISKIGAGELDHRISTARSDELGALAEHVNQMAARLESMLQAKRDLLLAISHELKSPLARSRVTLALLEESEYSKSLLFDHMEMQNLIDGIIDAERNHADFALLHREKTDMRALVERIVNGFTATGANITIAMDPGIIQAEVDRLQIERLLRNLIENALRYNDSDVGPVGVECRLEVGEVALKVVDHGCGIEPQHIGRLTEAFYRVASGRERNSGGLGLGLYLVNAVLDAHDGCMHIISEPGAGTSVVCKIPVEPKRANRASGPDEERT